MYSLKRLETGSKFPSTNSLIPTSSTHSISHILISQHLQRLDEGSLGARTHVEAVSTDSRPHLLVCDSKCSVHSALLCLSICPGGGKTAETDAA